MSPSRSHLARAAHRPDLPGTFRSPEPQTCRLLEVALLALPAPPDSPEVLRLRAQLGWPQWLVAHSAAALPDEFERTRLAR